VSRNELSQLIDGMTTKVEDARVKMQNVLDEEKNMERSFKRDLQTLSNLTIDIDSLKIFTTLYRQRKYHSIASEEDDEMRGTHIDRASKDNGARRKSFKRSFGTSASDGHAASIANRGTKLRQSKEVNSDGLGPMQQAAKQMKAQEVTHKQPLFNPNDPFFANLIAKDKEKKLAESQIPLLTPLSIDIDCPDGFNVDQFVWSKLQELRLARITKEIEGKQYQKQYNELKHKLDELTIKEDALVTQSYTLKTSKEKLLKDLYTLDNDIEIVIALKQGQDEVDCNAVVTDYSDAKLIPTGVINKYNIRVNELGKDKISVLTKIKQFRRKMNLVDWEAKHLELEAKHLEEYYTDCQLFRVTRDLQVLIKDGSDGDSKVRILVYLIFSL
jgi:hypothetical protein